MQCILANLTKGEHSTKAMFIECTLAWKDVWLPFPTLKLCEQINVQDFQIKLELSFSNTLWNNFLLCKFNQNVQPNFNKELVMACTKVPIFSTSISPYKMVTTIAVVERRRRRNPIFKSKSLWRESLSICRIPIKTWFIISS